MSGGRFVQGEEAVSNELIDLMKEFHVEVRTLGVGMFLIRPATRLRT